MGRPRRAHLQTRPLQALFSTLFTDLESFVHCGSRPTAAWPRTLTMSRSCASSHFSPTSRTNFEMADSGIRMIKQLTTRCCAICQESGSYVREL